MQGIKDLDPETFAKILSQSSNKNSLESKEKKARKKIVLSVDREPYFGRKSKGRNENEN